MTKRVTPKPPLAPHLYPTSAVCHAAGAPRWYLQRFENAGVLEPPYRPVQIGRANTSLWTANDALALAAGWAYREAGFSGLYVDDVAEFVGGSDPEALKELLDEGYTLVALA